jgi:hypothetical protein
MLNVLLNHTPQCLTRDLVRIHVNSNLDSNTINNLNNTNRDNRKVVVVISRHIHAQAMND